MLDRSEILMLLGSSIPILSRGLIIYYSTSLKTYLPISKHKQRFCFQEKKFREITQIHEFVCFHGIFQIKEVVNDGAQIAYTSSIVDSLGVVVLLLLLLR